MTILITPASGYGGTCILFDGVRLWRPPDAEEIAWLDGHILYTPTWWERTGQVVWSFDGYELRPIYGSRSAWLFDDEMLWPEDGGRSKGWLFNGRELKPVNNPEGDVWVASNDIPWPIMLRAAALI